LENWYEYDFKKEIIEIQKQQKKLTLELEAKEKD
jgi:hypothetical protein